MARKKKHEEHVNAEAWAIPYGDLVTLLFALFTVMYAMSSVNEGKFRVLSDSMIAAFHGTPKSPRPINMGAQEPGKGGDKALVGITPTALLKINSVVPAPPGGASTAPNATAPSGPNATASDSVHAGQNAADPQGATLIRLEREVQDAMQALIDAKLVTVRRQSLWLEVEINTDILFPSGSSAFVTHAEPVLDKLAQVLKPFPNPIRVEGHTDDRPIRTAAFPSNWELSAARAATVVHQFTRAGIDPLRLEIVGFGEYHPRQPNSSSAGRNANRRVAILILEASVAADALGARIDEPTPVASKAGDVQIADAAGAENRVLTRLPAGSLAAVQAAKGEGKPE
jgi:chemotaxis protein MotB